MLQQLIQRAIGIMFKFQDEWKTIQGEKWTVQDLFVKYALILGAIPAVCGFIGYALIGRTAPIIGTFRVPIGNAILWMVLQYVFSMGMVFGVAMVMDALAPTFGAKKDLLTSLKVVVFSWTAAWVGGVFMIVPAMAPLSFLAGIYALVLLFFGMKTIRKVPADKLIGYYVAVLAVSLVLSVLVFVIVDAIAVPSVGATASAMTSPVLESLR